jgi:hypothetical protein
MIDVRVGQQNRLDRDVEITDRGHQLVNLVTGSMITASRVRSHPTTKPFL